MNGKAIRCLLEDGAVVYGVDPWAHIRAHFMAQGDYEVPFLAEVTPAARAFWLLRHGEAERLRLAEEAAGRMRAEEQDRREWIEGVRRRLGLVAEVHRVRVWKRGEGDWAAQCLRPGCVAGRALGWAPSMEYALGDALAHAGHYLPLPPQPEPWTELDALAFEAAWDAVHDQQERMAAAFPARAAEVADQISAALADVLPEGMRFEWK